MIPVRDPSLYDGMTINEILLERKATLKQIEVFHKQRPTIVKAERIHALLDEIRALELLAKENSHGTTSIQNE